MNGQRDKFHGQTLWVVGRGPSLSRLAPAHLEAGPVMAINQAIERVEQIGVINPLYSLQKDRFFLMPERATVILHEQEAAKGMDLSRYKFPAGAILFDAPRDFGVPIITPSVVVALEFAHLWECSRVVYHCCDSVTSGDLGAYGMPPTQPADYLQHGPMARARAKALGLAVEWRRI